MRDNAKPSGKEHVIKYQVAPPKADIEIPVRVTYINSEKTLNKVMAIGSAEGMSASAMAIDPQDLQTVQSGKDRRKK